jgi:hypothetical protein
MHRFLRVFLAPARMRSVLLLAAACFVTAVAAAASISGTVTNQTVNKPSAGDTVSLIRLQQGMQVAAQTKTDASGHYTLNVSDADPMHLIRVTHQGADYFQPAPPGRTTVNVDVYDVAAKVKGVTTEADVQRYETDGNALHVTENFFINNASSPKMTQFGPHAYLFYLPKDADIASAAALGPGSMPVQSSPMPTGVPGQYAFVFPLRPGETRFQLSYRLPYTGKLEVRPRFAGQVDNFALILPKSMQFSPAASAGFQPVDQDRSVQTYLARNLNADSKLAFTISGTGQLPQETAAADTQGGSQAGPGGGEDAAQAAQAAAENNTRPGIGLGVPVDTPDPLHKYRWWIVSLIVVLVAVGAGISFRTPQTGSSPAVASGGAVPLSPAVSVPEPASTSALLHALKEELFALETERLQGKIGTPQYEQHKAALEVVLKRALHRTGHPPAHG